MSIQALIDKWELELKETINPDGITNWTDLGFHHKPSDFETIEDFLSFDANFDEREQTTISLINEILEDLTELKKEKRNKILC